ncbi:MAG: DUF4861 domain-containing protein [Paludibacteraceae bacterium]|nr:DUF4861 domain-containing protein [Paludibacteraceae bacterium]
MRNIIIALTMLLAALPVGAYQYVLTVANPLDNDVKDQPVVVRLDSLNGLKPKHRMRLAAFVDGKQVATQLDDMDRDGTPDELALTIDLKARESRGITLKTISKRQQAEFKPRVYADMIYKPDKKTMQYVTEMSSDSNNMYNRMHHHGVAFESEIMAYRLYFDNKQTVDMYGKKIPRLELEESLWYPTDEQLAQDYGDDILRVSGSVGLGTLKPWNGKKAVHYTDFSRRTQRIIAAGPVRTVCELELLGWKHDGIDTDITFRYILYAGHRDCIVEVRANTDIDNIVTGVQKVNNGIEGLYKGTNIVGCWGTDWPVNDTVKYAKETVGLGVYVPQKYVVKNVEDKVNNLLLLHYTKGEVMRYYITCYSMKERGTAVTNRDEFFEYLMRWRECITKQ